jgi:hypothetical protein
MCVPQQTAQPTKACDTSKVCREDRSSFVLIQDFLWCAGMAVCQARDTEHDDSDGWNYGRGYGDHSLGRPESPQVRPRECRPSLPGWTAIPAR